MDYLFPYVLYRRSVLSTQELDHFNHPFIFEIAKGYVENEQLIEKKSEKLVLDIEKAVGDTDHQDLKKVLINIKRKVFNHKRIDKQWESAKNLISEVDGSLFLYQPLSDYNDFIHRQGVMLEELEASQHKITMDERKKLHHTLKNSMHEVKKAFKFINSDIDEKLKKYESMDPSNHNKKLRKLDITLLKVLTRAAAKTSPFSTLTYSGFYGPYDYPAPASIITKTQINETYLYRILEKVHMHPSVYQQLTFILTPNRSIDEKILYWTTLVDNKYEHQKTYKTADRLVKLKLSSLVVRILDAFSDQPFDYGDFHQKAVEWSVPEEKVRLYFESFLEKGLFLPTKTASQNADNLMAEVIDEIKRFQSPYFTAVVANLEQVNSVLEEYDSLSYAQQLEAHNVMIEIMKNTFDQLSIDHFHKGFVAYQDSIRQGMEPMDHFDESEVKEALAEVMTIFNLFNISYILQRRIAKAVKRQYGTEWIVLEDEWEDFIRVILDCTTSNLDIWNKQFRKDLDNEMDQVEEKLFTAKKRIFNLLESNINQNQVDMDKDFLEKVEADLPEYLINRRQSNSFFLQKDKDQYVVNHFYEGNLKYFSRFIKFYPEMRRDAAFDHYINKAIDAHHIVDVNSTFGFNANNRYSPSTQELQLLNTPAIGRHIDLDKPLIKLEDLQVKYNSETEMLDIYHGDRKINISFLGSLMPMMLPGLVTSLTILANENALYYDFSINYAVYAIEHHPSTFFMKLPEVKYKSLILSRRKWIFNLQVSSELENLVKHNNTLGLYRFLRKYQIPNQVYVTGFDIVDNDLNIDKPQFINFTSPNLLKLLSIIIMNNKSLMIEEAKPSPTEKKENDYVEEIVLELTKGVTDE